MPDLSSEISDYCSSEHFLFLDSALKPHAETLLHVLAESAGGEMNAASVDSALKKVVRLDLPLEVRKAAPALFAAFFDYVSATGRHPEASAWSEYASQAAQRYVASFRDDGSVRGETFRKQYTDVGRNDPCPCGSGLKFKKCCMKLIA